MRIQKFGIICTTGFAIIATFVALTFYVNERRLILQTLMDDLQRNIYQLDDDIKHAIQSNNQNEIQRILELAPVLNKNIVNVSFSKDHHVIDLSSTNTLKGTLVSRDYIEFNHLQRDIFDSHSYFKTPVTYYENGKKVDGLLLININDNYVFGRLNQVALFYIVLVLLIIVLGAYTCYLMMRQLIIRPLEQVTIHARDANAITEEHFITELSELDNTLTVSFEKLKDQKDELLYSLNETLYLQEILKTVADINHLLIASENITELLDNSANRLAKHSGYNSCWIALDQSGDLVVEALSKSSEGYIKLGQKMANILANHDDPICQTLVIGKSNIITELRSSKTFHTWQVFSKHARDGSFISIPLVTNIHQKPIGVVCIYSNNLGGVTDKELSMLEELAGDIGFAVNAFRQRDALKHQLTTCHLTGLPNRMSLVKNLEVNSNVTVALINIERFSEINDVYGIDVGDKFLVEYGNWLTNKIADKTEIMLYKFPGDLYALMTNASTSIDDFCEFLEVIVSETDKTSFILQDIEILASITIGVAWSSKRVLEHAVQASKQAKVSRNRIQIYENMPHRHNFSGNISWYKRIKSAIAESRFVPYFHPIVDNITKKIIKYEALIRLIEPDGKVISPHEFIDISKKMRLYSQLTAIIVEKSCVIFKDKNVPVSINLSIQDLLNNELADKIEQIIIDYQMGNKIVFEILETENIANYEGAKQFIDRFRSIGCRFAIDDFGAGYSNFEQLLKLNVDTIKIDGSLIKNIKHDMTARTFVSHISALARELGIKTIAEYVSDQDIYLLVKEIGIGASQGYYFHEPSIILKPEDEA